MNIQIALDSIATGLAADNVLGLVPNKSEIRTHAGKFSWEELKVRNYSAPAVFVSCLGWEKPAEEPAGFAYPRYVLNVRFIAGIVTKSAKNREARNAQARAIAEQLTQHLMRETRWELPDDEVGVPDAQRIRAEGLFVPSAEADNQSLWIVTWYQLVQSDPYGIPVTLGEFEGFDADHFKPGADISTETPLAQTTDTYEDE